MSYTLFYVCTALKIVIFHFLRFRTNKDLPGGGNFSDGISDLASSVNPSPSLASLADLTDDSTIERSYIPTAPVLVTHSTLTSRPHSGSTGDLPSATQHASHLLRRQLSAIETPTSYMKGLLKNAMPSTIKSESVREGEKCREDEGIYSTPQYKVIYKDMCEVASSGGSIGPGRLGDRAR